MATSYLDLLGPSLVRKSSSKVKRFDTLQTLDVVRGCVVGLLFAAEWSEESSRFCAVLAETHRQVTEAGGQLALVLVSSDRDVDAFVRTLAGAWPRCHCRESLPPRGCAALLGGAARELTGARMPLQPAPGPPFRTRTS